MLQFPAAAAHALVVDDTIKSNWMLAPPAIRSPFCADETVVHAYSPVFAPSLIDPPLNGPYPVMVICMRVVRMSGFVAPVFFADALPIAMNVTRLHHEGAVVDTVSLLAAVVAKDVMFAEPEACPTLTADVFNSAELGTTTRPMIAYDPPSWASITTEPATMLIASGTFKSGRFVKTEPPTFTVFAPVNELNVKICP